MIKKSPLFTHNEQPMVIVDDAYIIRSSNQAFKNFCGTNPDNKPISISLRSPDIDTAIESVNSQNVFKSVEFSIFQSVEKFLLAQLFTIKHDRKFVLLSITDISDKYLHTLIELDGVQFKDNEIGGNYYSQDKDLGGATNRVIVDGLGYELIVRTSSYADFASSPLPTGNGKIRGVLTRFGDDYQLFPRTENDINMNSSRTSVNRLGIGAMKSKSEGKIEDNYYIEGVVTMSPSAGNITDRNIIIQDETGGIVVRFDNNVGSGVKEGNKLKILVKDARMGSFANVTQVSDINYSGKIDGENIVTLIEENATLPTPIKLTLDELKRGNYEWRSCNNNSSRNGKILYDYI